MRMLIYDVHASESGALAILDDLYKKICDAADGSVEYLFVVSTPEYKETEHIKVESYPWVKKSWLHRLYFDHVTTRSILKRFKPDKVYSLQNQGIPFFNGEQDVYLHLPFVLCDYKFDLKKDGKRLWLYQNVLSKSIFSSLRKVSKVIVQTNWMKDALIKKAHVKPENIVIEAPDITMNHIGQYEGDSTGRKTFFYPATSFRYKNHITVLNAIKFAVDQGLKDYEVIFTIKKDENEYTEELYDYAMKNNLNVDFHGQIPRDKVFELYTRSVLLFPSMVESFGMPLLEARLTGAPVFASNCPFCKEILDGYEKSKIFDGYDYESLGRYILDYKM